MSDKENNNLSPKIIESQEKDLDLEDEVVKEEIVEDDDKNHTLNFDPAPHDVDEEEDIVSHETIEEKQPEPEPFDFSRPHRIVNGVPEYLEFNPDEFDFSKPHELLDGVPSYLTGAALEAHIQKEATWAADKIKREALEKIQKLEASITDRRMREAILGKDGGWLNSIEAEIATLRVLINK